MTPAEIFLPHRIAGTLIEGRLRARPNRFLGIVELFDGTVVEAHIADRGRLEAILYPGAEVWLVPAASSTRRTAFSLVCARCPPLGDRTGRGPLACLDPAGANRLVRALLEAGAIEGIPLPRALRQEVRAFASRFDFALEHEAGRMLIEVKSAAVAEGRAALFPDAPSERAARHCRELAALRRSGEGAAIVLVAQRADVSEIRPHPIDPEFARALAEAERAGVLLRGVAFDVGLDGFRFAGMRPVIAEAGA